ncbi:hypothetical protein B0H12DRAFT_1146896 [Mycena haematopus]|nr:hypothetical protein B0H12DRAFT_1146896 [Mycena haematopus]
MVRFGQGALVIAVVLWSYTPGILSMTITGPSSAVSNSSVTFTWTSVSSDPTTFEIDVDQALNTLNQSDPYWIINDLTTADGSATVSLPVLSAGTHRIAFSSTDGFNILAEGSIEILAEPASSSVPVSIPPPPPTSSSASPAPSLPPTSSNSQSSSHRPQSQTASSGAPQSPSNPTSPSPAATSLLSQSSSSQSQIGAASSTGGPQIAATKHHTNAGAIAGGVVGAIVVILLALLGWWYFRRRSRSTAAAESHGETSQFLAAPISSALAVHNNQEFRPWEDTETTLQSHPLSRLVKRLTSVTSRKQPITVSRDPAVMAPYTTQPTHQPSREELFDEVQRLRAQVRTVSPPPYYGE